MTEAVKGICEATEIGGNSKRDGIHKRLKVKKPLDEGKDDCVDISEEARDRASGKKHRNILEYMENEP